jgi:hypothetical protein
MMRVKIRLIYEAEYTVTPGSAAYPGCTTVEECVEIDRQQFMSDDDGLLLSAVEAHPVALEIVRQESTGGEGNG